MMNDKPLIRAHLGLPPLFSEQHCCGQKALYHGCVDCPRRQQQYDRKKLSEAFAPGIKTPEEAKAVEQLIDTFSPSKGKDNGHGR